MQLATKPPGLRQAKTRSVVILFVALIAAVAAAIAFGLLPRLSRQKTLLAESQADTERAPVVGVLKVRRSAAKATLELPGDLQALTETPIYARADGYLKKRYVDIGDRIHQGQLLAELETPELDQQIRQAEAALSQSRAAIKQFEAQVAQAKANLKLAKSTLDRYQPLAQQGVFSRQDWDEKQAAFEAKQADVAAADANLAAANNAVGANEANVQRLEEMKAFGRILAPFNGVVTARNVDIGTLISSGNGGANREMFRVAQIDPLRIFVNVPQTYVSATQAVGATGAQVAVQQLPGRKFPARIDRINYALDQNSRTMLAILLVSNPKAELLPGMYAQVTLSLPESVRPLVVPGDAIVARSSGPHVAVVDANGIVQFRKIQPGRDLGPEMEVYDGVKEGESVIVNPTDAVRDGVRVQVRSSR